MSRDEKKVLHLGKWERLKREITPNKEMISVKLITFFFVAGIGSFLPFLTLHMTEVGLTMQEITIIYAFIPIASMIGPCIAGMVADKLGNYTVTLAISIFLCGLFHTLLLVVPVNQANLNLTNMKNSNYQTSFSCDRSGHSLISNGSTPGNLEVMTHLDISYMKNCIVGRCERIENETQICAFSNEESDALFCLKNKFAENISLQGMTSLQEWGNIASLNITCSNPCLLECRLRDGSGENYNPYKENIASSNLTFYLYFFLRTMAALTLCSSFSMVDSVTLAKMQNGDGDYGKQRVMTMLAQAFAPLVSGLMVDRLSVGKDSTDYSAVFYFGDAMFVVAMVIACKMSLQVEMPSQNLFKDLLRILKDAEINIFLVIVTLLGVNWGFLETYLFIYLTEIGAPIYLLGITLTVGMCSGIPALYMSDAIVEKFGRNLIFLLSFVAYAVRLIGYSQISNPWMCLPFELLEVITYQIMWVAAATYCLELAPKGLLATMTCIAGGAHYSMGRGIGSFLGGNLMLWYGSVKTFRIFGYLSIAGGIFYLATYYGYVKAERKRKDLLKEKEADHDSMEELKDMI